MANIPYLPAGLNATIMRNVTLDTLADRLGNPTPAQVLATPILVAWFEAAVSRALLPHLAPDQLILGAHIAIEHRRPTPPGHNVWIQARLERQEGNQTLWHVVARDEHEVVAEGEVRSALIDQERFHQRLASKQKPFFPVADRSTSRPD